MQIRLFLVYRCKIFTETGRHCRATLAWRYSLNWAVLAAILLTAPSLFSQIDLPVPPKAVPPPQIPAERNPVNIRHEEHLKEQEAVRTEEKATVEQKVVQKQIEQAKKEQADPRPMYGFIELNMVYPKFLTSGPRKQYNGDFATHISAWSRLNYSKPSNDVQLWAGFRIAPFSGTGIQKNHAGRFALTYFGPGIGVGSVDGRTSSSSDDESRSGWLLSTGVAAVSRLTPHKEQPDPGASDFDSTAYAADNPGIWIECRWMRIINNALSVDVIGGGQLAEGKNIPYFGLGIAGWL